MRMRVLPLLAVALLLAVCLTVSGVSAAWVYYEGDAEPISNNVSSTSMGSFHYGLLYITKAEITGGAYQQATVTKTDDVNLSANVTLNKSTSSTAVAEVTFYNSTDVSYYYNKTETVSTNNNAIQYEVTGIEQKEEVRSKTFKTVTVTFSYSGSNTSSSALLSELHFNFVVDKDSIGVVVAQTAVGRFQDILNNVVAADSYSTLENAMDNRGGSFNKASAVTYIGNVAGSSSGDSATLNGLFGAEFMSMDLDGDGKSEPITMMVKRENLDNDLATGDSYSYTSWGREYTVSGVEMTIYITAQNLSNVSSGADVTVYAAVFTLPANGTQWIQIVPLTKGVADANNYNGWGDANSFNTDTWRSDANMTIETLVSENLAK